MPLKEAYPYRPLDFNRQEIRTPRVECASKCEALLRCNMQHVFLDESSKLECEAASYCWGKSRAKVNIKIDGQLVKVQASAEEVLRGLRLRNRSYFV